MSEGNNLWIPPYKRSRLDPIKPADVIVYLDDQNRAVAVDRKGNLVAGPDSDHASVIQAAIDDVPNGGKIVISPGKYTISRRIDILKKVHLVGVGTTVGNPQLSLASGVDDSLLKIGDYNSGIIVGGVVIEGIYFNGNKAGQTVAKPLIDFNYFNDVLVDKCWIYGSKGHGLRIGVGWTFKFERGAIEGNDGYAVYVEPVTTTEQDFVVIDKTNISGGVYLQQHVWFLNNNIHSGWVEAYSSYIRGNKIVGAGSPNGAVITIKGNNTRIVDNYINSSHSSITYTFYVESTANDNVLIKDNMFISPKGIYFEDGYKRLGRTLWEGNIGWDPWYFSDQTTDANGQIMITFPWTVNRKPLIHVAIEGNYNWYISAWSSPLAGMYNGVTIQFVDPTGANAPAGVVAHIKITPVSPQ